jgi:endonuclease/exonuclease/phosphatase family metal-dependent hydrolase
MLQRMRLWLRCGALVTALAGFGCAPGINYPSLFGPRYAGGELALADDDSLPGALRVVTFNTRHAARLEAILAVLQHTPALGRPDVMALQEVDAAATARIAQALGMRYVYYPATRHPKYGKDFGNAVLARWPIVDDDKLVLPHLGRFRQTERVVTAATILVGDMPIRVYSAHLGMLTEIGPGSKRDQAQAIIADAKDHEHVIVLGDMNSHGIGKTFRRAGYHWPTENNPRTIQIWNWDHVFLKGMTLSERGATGVIKETHGASDHRPVWATITSPNAVVGTASP